MVAVMVFAVGAAVSLSFFYLARGVAGFTPGFDRDTLDRIGVASAFALYCCAGPVLLARALENAAAGSPPRGIRDGLALAFLMLVWSGALGIAVLESARALL